MADVVPIVDTNVEVDPAVDPIADPNADPSADPKVEPDNKIVSDTLSNGDAAADITK